MKAFQIVRTSLLAACLGASAFAADVQVIANNAVGSSDVSTDDLKRIFLGTKSALGDGSKVEPVLAHAGAAHESFLKQVVGKSDTALRNYFKTLVFTGKGSMPKSFNSDADILSYVSKTKGAIGYINGSASASGVKVIELK